MEQQPGGGSKTPNVVPRYLLVREFLNSRFSETKLLCHSLKRKLGEDIFGSSAVDGKSRRRATSPRNWKFWQRDERKRKRKGKRGQKRGGASSSREAKERDEEGVVGKRAREVSHARVVGEEVRLLFSSSFDFASRFYISFALARFTLDADEE